MVKALLVARTLRQALLASVLLLLDAAVFATEAAAPAALAARWPLLRTQQRRRLLAEGLAAASTAVTTTGCTGASAGLAPDQCAAWGKFFDGAGGPHWTGRGGGCTKEDPCGSCTYGVTCSGSSITFMCAPTRCRVPRWRRACRQTRANPAPYLLRRPALFPVPQWAARKQSAWDSIRRSQCLRAPGVLPRGRQLPHR